MKFYKYLLFFLIPMSVFAQNSSVYKWVDAKGLVHYGDRPAPANEPSRSETALTSLQLGVTSSSSDAGKALAAGQKDVNQTSRETKEKDQAQKARAAREAEHERQCIGAKASLRTLEAGGRISSVNEKGERIILNDDEIASKKMEASKNVDDACAPLPPDKPSIQLESTNETQKK